jgi:hypothetical protein
MTRVMYNAYVDDDCGGGVVVVVVVVEVVEVVEVVVVVITHPRLNSIVLRHLRVSMGEITQHVAATLRAAMSLPVTENWSPR